MKIMKRLKQYTTSIFRSLCAPLGKNSRVARQLIRKEGELTKPIRKAIKQYAIDVSDSVPIFLESYEEKTVKTVKTAHSSIPSNEPLFLCVVKDDLIRVKAQLKYHREIGIKHFAYIDNMSTDGTYEWLKEQHDVSLFVVNEKFKGPRKAAWKRQVMDIIGYNMWYLILDSDEFFCYPGIENISISQYIKYLEKRQLESAFAMMIDMYPKGTLFTEQTEDSFMNEFCYFDIDTYCQCNLYQRESIRGGVRVRIFSKQHELSKHPLFFAKPDTIPLNHRLYPINCKRSQKKPIAFLLHYKHFSYDIQRYNEFIKSEAYYDKSAALKIYMDAYSTDTNFTFYYEGSQKYNSSMDLLKINIGDKQFFKKFLVEHRIKGEN